MSSFIINLSNSKKYNEELRGELTKYQKSISEYLSSLSKVEDAWNDFNTEYFLKNLNKDKEEIIEHFNVLNRYITKKEIFDEELKNVVSEYAGSNSISSVKYNSEYLLNAIETLNYDIKALETLKKEFVVCRIPNNDELENTVRRLFSEMDTSELKNSNNNISNLVKKTEKLLDVTKVDIKAIPYKEINNHVCELVYQVMSLEELQKFDFNQKDEIL